MIHLSFDQDWAPAWATEQVEARLAEAGLRGTLFVTHACPSLPGLRARGHLELGWHPNFLARSSHGSSTREVLDHLHDLVPEARGARAHHLIRGTHYLQAYQERGLIYDGADIHDRQPNLQPFLSWTGMVRVPIFFEDDVHLSRGRSMDLEAAGVQLKGLKVFSFHPVLLALNAADMEGYAGLKQAIAAAGTPLDRATEADFEPFVNRSRPGVGDLLIQLIERLSATPAEQGGALVELADAFLESRG